MARFSIRLARVLFAVTTLAVTLPASADDALPGLAANAPETYVVREGDTLWDISSVFLNEPWRWPELWRVNPSVRDPNLIFPGDTLYLRWENGRPGVYLNRPTGSDVVRLSPAMRSEGLGSAIPQIPRDKIDPFIKRHRFEAPFVVENAPRILSGDGGRLISGIGDTVFVGGDLDANSEAFEVFRPAGELEDPETRESLGILLYSVGRVSPSGAIQAGAANRMSVTRASSEMRSGDILFPVSEGRVDAFFRPKAPANSVSGAVLAVDGGVSQIGSLDIVATNVGSIDGVEAGDLLSVLQRGQRVRDEKARQWLELPDTRAGLLMVFAVYERASFGLVLSANRPLSVGDKLGNP